MSRRGVLLPISLAVFAACLPQVDGDHQGEVLAAIQGTLESHSMMPLEHPEVSLVWSQRSHMYLPAAAERVSAEGLFPRFKLSIYARPPDCAIDTLDGGRSGYFGLGMVVVGDRDADFTRYEDWRGVDLDRVVIYLARDVAADETLAGFLHGPVSAGFHLYSVHRLTEDERRQRLDCVNALPGGSGMIDLHEAYLRCGGVSNDELNPIPGDLDSLVQISIIDVDVVSLINSLPQW